MKAYTVRQPGATLIALGVKRILTRSEPPPKGMIGQRIAIHAGRSLWPFQPSDPSLWSSTDRLVAQPELWGSGRVGYATLANVLPIVTWADMGDPECIVNHMDGSLDHAIPSWAWDNPTASHVPIEAHGTATFRERWDD